MFPLSGMAGRESHLTKALQALFSQEAVIERIVQVIKDLGVESNQDLMYVAAEDLAGALKPIEVRKVIACIKCKSK